MLLQHKIECFLAGVVEGNLSATESLKDRLAAVRTWRSAWRTMQWTEKHSVRKVFDVGISEISGSVYAKSVPLPPSDDEHSLEFYRLGSRLRGVSEKQWTLDNLPEHETFTFDYEEDLLVLVQA